MSHTTRSFLKDGASLANLQNRLGCRREEGYETLERICLTGQTAKSSHTNTDTHLL